MLIEALWRWLHEDPIALADRLVLKLSLDPDVEKLRISE